MSNLDPDASSSPRLSVEQQLELDCICTEFETQWNQHPDSPPQLLIWLDRWPAPLNRALFRELLAIDIDFRSHHSLPVSTEELQRLYPANTTDIECVLKSIADRNRRDVVAASESLSVRLAAQQSEHLRDFIASLEQAPVTELPPEIANWTQQQLARARNLEKTILRPSSSLTTARFASRRLDGLEQLGDFRIVREIGRGGMGTVFEAEQLSLHRRVALKVLWLGGQQNSESIQRFEREATTIANLHHTNIVPIFAVGEQDGVNYYAMQLIDGQSLDSLTKLKADNSLDPEQIVDWAVQAADALSHAHERGVIHRDIKPSNLMLDSSGRLWLTDFGLAKREQDHSLSLAGVMLGTPRYMSPEQASSNLQTVDHRCDIYSLGATLYELLTGRPVFDGNSPYILIKQILTEEPSAVDKIRPQIPRDLATIVMKCLRKDPRERYATASDLLADLRCVQEGRPIKARRAGVVEMTGKWIKRHQQTVRTAVVATAVLAMITLGMLLTWMTVDQYFTTQLKLKMGSTPATVAFLDARGEMTRTSIALPTTESLTLQSEPLTLRFMGIGHPSLDYRWLAKPQAIEEFQVELQQQDWNYPRQPRLNYQIVGTGPKQLIVSWTNERLYLDIPGTLQSPPQIQESSVGMELAKLSDQTKVLWVASLGSDLDEDGIDEVLVAMANQAVVHVVSRSNGRLWVQTFTADATNMSNLEQPIQGREHRGTVFQWPELVPDQDGDGKLDVLISIGQNPIDPPSDATKTTRSVALVSATGKLLWRHHLDNDLFRLPVGAVVAPPLQWQLTEPYTTGTKNLSSFVVRNGRKLRHLDRQSISEAPHCEAPQAKWFLNAGRNEVLIRTATQLQRLDLANGNVVMPPQETGIVSAVPFICRDFDSDGKTEVLLIESLPPINNPVAGSLLAAIPQTRLVLWSLQKQVPVWETVVDSKPPAYSPNLLADANRQEMDAGTGHRWPVVLNDSVHGATWFVLPWKIPRNVGYTGLSMPSSELALVEAGTGKVSWTCRVPNMDCWTDQIAVLPDINRDGTPEVAIASLWGEPFEWVVECRSGRDGELLWLQHQETDQSQFDEVASLSYLPNSGRLQLNLKNVEHNQAAFQMRPNNGEIVQTLHDFQNLEFLDFDGDEVEDWCITRSELIAGVKHKTLQIVKGNFRDRWRRLGAPVQIGSDFDLDGVVDLLSIKKDGVQAFSARNGELLWQHQPSANWAECRVSTWETEQSRSQAAGQQADAYGMAKRESWDVDGDSTLDLVLQAVTLVSGESHPAFLVLSGRTGQPLWQSRAKLSHHEAMPPLTICDLDGNNRLDILAVEWLPQSQNKGTSSEPRDDKHRQAVSLSRWEVGNEEAFWTLPLEGPNDASVMNRWNWEADLQSFPRPALLKIDQDDVADLALVIEPQSAAEVPQLMIGGVSGRDGQVIWKNPLGIFGYDQTTIAQSERYVTADVDADGRDDLIFLSFANHKNADNTPGRVAQLRAWDATTGKPKWLYEYPVANDFMQASNSRVVKPIVGRNEDGQHWIAMTLRTSEQRDVVVVVDGNGQLLDSHQLERDTPHYFQGFPCWRLDLDGDGQDELLFDDGESLVSFQVNEKLQKAQRFPIRARESDVEVSLSEVNGNQQHLVVIRHSDYHATGFDLSTGHPLWRVVGPQSQKQYRADRSAVQIVNKAWSGQPVPGFDAPWIVFNGYREETILQTATLGPMSGQTRTGLEIESIPADTATKSLDFRQARTLPWAEPNSQFAVLNTNTQLVTLIGFVLVSSGLLIWLPHVVWRCMRLGWISHLGALLLGISLVALNLLFFGQTFTIPFLLERPEWHDKLTVAFSYAPLWAVVYTVPQWIWRGEWRRGIVWVLLTLGLSVAWGGWALYQDQVQAPLAQGEYYAISWSPAILAIGLFSASWLGALIWGAMVLLGGLTKLLERFFGRSSGIVESLKSWQPKGSKLEAGAKAYRRPRYVRTLYLWGIATIGFWVVLCPDWQGVSYRPEGASSNLDFTHGAVENGGFGLDERTPHFLWAPPISAGGLPTTIRWPWQFVSNPYHIELDLRPMLLRFIGALAVWGAVLFALGSLSQIERLDTGWHWVGLMTLLWTIALLAALVLQVFTMGYLPGVLELEVLIFVLWAVGYAATWWLSRMKNGTLATPANASGKSRPINGKVRFLIDAWLLVLGFALSFGLGLWLVNVTPALIDPEWQPLMGPGLGGPRASTMNLIGWIYFGLAFVMGSIFSWFRSMRGTGIGFFIGWMVWAVYCWGYK